MLAMIWKLLLIFAITTQGDRLYSVAYKDIDVNGFVCDGPPKAIVFYPSNGRPHQVFPVVSFLHGYNSGGNDSRLTFWYGALLGNISAYGFVIIAPLTSVTKECPKFAQDQLTALRADFKANGIPADPSRAAVFGQSAGGPPAIHSAGQQGYNIRAAVVLHPAGANPLSGLGIRVPVLFGTGSADVVAPALNVGLLYRATRVADKSYGVLKGAGHNEAAGGGDGTKAGRWPHWVGPWLLCHLSGERDQCEFFSQRFCSGDVDHFTTCHTPKSQDETPPDSQES
jgi:pimeloyl-ACP methyl ester carboxylesterase